MSAEFPIMQRCHVNGLKAHPIFQYLRASTEELVDKKTGKVRNIPWNFAKFIINKKGEVLRYMKPRESLYD